MPSKTCNQSPRTRSSQGNYCDYANCSGVSCPECMFDSSNKAEWERWNSPVERVEEPLDADALAEFFETVPHPFEIGSHYKIIRARVKRGVLMMDLSLAIGGGYTAKKETVNFNLPTDYKVQEIFEIDLLIDSIAQHLRTRVKAIQRDLSEKERMWPDE